MSTVGLDDEVLFDAWRSGDERAGALLFARYYTGVSRFFIRKLGCDCEDLIQATFLGCLERIDSFRGDASFRALVFAIARNKLLKHLRERDRDRRRFVEGEVELEADTPGADRLLLAGHEQRQLFAGLLRLSPDTRVLFELHYWGNLTIREIAEILELPMGTVKIRMYRARRQIAAAIDGPAAELGVCKV